MNILATNDSVIFKHQTTGFKTSYPINSYECSFSNSSIIVREKGTERKAREIQQISYVTSITDNRTGGAGVVPVPADLDLLYDILQPFFYASTSTSGGASEATLLSVLAAIVDTQDLEIKLVRDTGDGDVVVQQIRSYDQDTKAWTTTYEKVGGSAHTVIGPLEYLDASAVLNLILTELQTGNIKTNTDNLTDKSTLHKLKNDANDLIKVFSYYSTSGANNPSGNKNIETIVYSSVVLGTSATETFVWDIEDDVLTVNVS